MTDPGAVARSRREWRRPDAPERRLPDDSLTAGIRWTGRATVALLVLSLLALVVKGANGPANPHLAPSGAVRSIPGFGQIAFKVQPAAGPRPAGLYCAALADSAQQHQRGMMARHDLGGYDAMVFRFSADTATPFYNRNVPITLSIAWFDASGRYVKGTDMPACPDIDACPLFQSGAPYRYALETPQGGLAHLGVGPGSSIAVGGSCA